MTEPVYAISVKFKNRGTWSQEYTYTYSTPLEVDSLVVVPNNRGFYDVARVKRNISNYEFSPQITYKKILRVLDFKYTGE